jgi:predicted DNA-binding ribbon-helix-helix protein
MGAQRKKEGSVMTDSGRIDLMSTLVSRNVSLQDRRTSVRLEPAMWEALDEICRREGRNINELCGMIDRQRRESKLTAAIRVFVMAYYRAASTDEGHVGAGHGILRHAAASAESRTPKKPKPTGPGKR